MLEAELNHVAGLWSDENARETMPGHDIHVAGEPIAFAALVAWLLCDLELSQSLTLSMLVAATTSGTEGHDVSHGRDILIGDQPAEFAAHVVCLLRDIALRQRLVANACRLVEQHYDWVQIGQRFVDLVEDIASRHVSKRLSA